jgi:predicted metal-binding protein
MVTHSSTSRPVQCLCMCGRDGVIYLRGWNLLHSFLFLSLSGHQRDTVNSGTEITLYIQRETSKGD